MPYPEYSIVVIEETTNGITEEITLPFKNASEARNIWKDAVNSGKRAFLYEKPQPSSFRRNDSQPISP
jgi:uncharacterized protein (DUF2344 family)